MPDDGAPPTRGPVEGPETSGGKLDRALAEVAILRQQLMQRGEQADRQAWRETLAQKQLQHRARNTMALVRSAFQRTVETGKALDDIEMHFCGRLDVLAHYMLPHSGACDETVDVQNVIRGELRNFQFGDAPGITIEGPDAGLSQDQAQPFALAIHELATNALKYGALCVQDATLSVTWDLDDRHLILVWEEAGVPIVFSAPMSKGFGQEFVEEALPYQIGATTQFELKPGGLLCTIQLQLEDPKSD